MPAGNPLGYILASLGSMPMQGASPFSLAPPTPSPHPGAPVQVPPAPPAHTPMVFGPNAIPGAGVPKGMNQVPPDALESRPPSVPPSAALPMIQTALNDPEAMAEQAASAGLEPPAPPPGRPQIGSLLAGQAQTPGAPVAPTPNPHPPLAPPSPVAPQAAPQPQQRPEQPPERGPEEASPFEALFQPEGNVIPPPSAGSPGRGGSVNPAQALMELLMNQGGQGGAVPGLGQLLAQGLIGRR